MDIQELSIDRKSNAGVWMQFKHPKTKAPLTNNEGQPMRVLLAGNDSKLAKEFERENRDRLQKVSKTRVERDGMTVDTNMEVSREVMFDKQVKLTLGWENIVFGGEVLEFSTENVKRVYTHAPDLLDQVAEFISDRANFIEGPSQD